MNIYDIQDLLENISEHFKNFFKPRLSLKERLEVYEIMSSFFEDSIPPLETIDSMIALFHKTKKKKLEAILIEWKKDLLGSSSLSEVMGKNIPIAEQILISASESVGDVNSGFKNAIFLSESVKKIKSILYSTLIYPVVLVILAFVVQWGYSVEFVPMFIMINKNVQEWPLITKIAAGMTTDVTALIPYITILVFSYFFISIIALSRYHGFLRRYLDKVPPWNIYKSLQSASFLLTISGFLESGYNIEVAIPKIMKISSPWLNSHLEQMVNNIYMAVPYGEAMDTGLISTEEVAKLQAYGKVSSFAIGVNRIAKEVVDKTISQITISSSLMRTFGMFLVGVTMIICIFGFYSLISSMHTGG